MTHLDLINTCVFEQIQGLLFSDLCGPLKHKQKLLILSRFSDFMTCSEHFNIFSEGSLSQLWKAVGRYVNQTLIYTNYD